MAEIVAERRVPVYKLLVYKDILKQLQSFSDCVTKCNFSVRKGWMGKWYVDKHEVDEWKIELRGVEMLDVYYLRPTDTCVLTNEQYEDFNHFNLLKN